MVVAVAACLLAEVLDCEPETRVTAVLLLVDVVELTLLADCDVAALPTLLLVPMPPLVDTLLANTRSVLLILICPLM